MWRNMAFKRITNIDRLGLLLWKNYRLVIRTRTKVFALIAIPVCFAMTFLIIKMAMPMSEKDHRTYVGFNITASPVRPAGSNLAFISNNFKNASLIMEEVERILDLNTSLEFFDDNDMVSYLRYDSLGLGIGGVIFRKDGAKLTVVIRVATLATNKALHSWHTDSLFPWQVEIHSRYEDDGSGGPIPGYAQTGFMSIQSAVSIAYLGYMGNNTKIPEIILKRFPHRPHPVHQSLLYCKVVLNIGTLIGFYFVCLYNVKVEMRISN